MSTKIVKPAAAEAPITARFGSVSNVHPNGHSGADFGWWGGNPNRPVYSPIDGKVTEAFYGNVSPSGLGGWITIVSHDGVYKTQLGHLNKNSDRGVRVGDTVKAGQHVANYGVPTTGRSTGPHLHVNFWVKGVRADIMKYVGSSQTSNPKASSGSPTGWSGGTLFKGTYSTQLGGVVHTVPVGGPWPSAKAAQAGVTLEQVDAWTQALAKSKWAGEFLQPGGSYLNSAMLLRGATFYAGGVYATGDAVALLEKREAEAEAEAALKNRELLAGEEKEKTALLAIAKEDLANAEGAEAFSPEGEAQAVEEAKAVKELAEKELEKTAQEKAAAEAALQAALAKALKTGEELTSTLHSSGENVNPNAPLAGLLTEHPNARKKAYYAFAGTALLVSFGPDVLIAGVLSESVVPVASAYIALASSLLLKVGTAFGFVAASNTLTESK